jgi:hypothetical protein
MSHRLIIGPDGDVLLELLHQPPPIHQEPLPVEECTLGRTFDSADGQTQTAIEPRVPDVQMIGRRELLISSKILIIASPVYKAMFNGRFLEGTTLENAKACPGLLPYRLPHPEDNDNAVTLLCQILHNNTDSIPDRPSLESLEDLATVCDKYQCTSSLRFCGAIWLRNWLIHYEEIVPDIDSICRLLFFAYVADLGYEFQELSWKLLLYHKGPFTGQDAKAVSLIGHPLLRHDIGSKYF